MNKELYVYSVQIRRHSDKRYASPIRLLCEYTIWGAWQQVVREYGADDKQSDLYITDYNNSRYRGDRYYIANTKKRDYYFVLLCRGTFAEQPQQTKNFLRYFNKVPGEITYELPNQL